MLDSKDLLFAQLSAIAYSKDAIAQYRALNYRAAPLHHLGASDEVFILSNGADICIVARGSDDVWDWTRRNMLALPQSIPTLRGIRAHWGFWDAARSVLAAATAAIEISKPDSVTIAGHSKGGAMAVLLGLALQQYKPAIVTFGCPRVLTSENLPCLNHRRIVHALDPVARVSPRIGGWVHEGLPVVIRPSGMIESGDAAWAKVLEEPFDIGSLGDRAASHFEYGPDIKGLRRYRS